MEKKIEDAEKFIRVYAILTTESDIASLKRKGKIKKGSEINDVYYEGLVKGLTMRLPESIKNEFDKTSHPLTDKNK